MRRLTGQRPAVPGRANPLRSLCQCCVGDRYHILPNYDPAAARASCEEAAGWRELYLHNDDVVSYEHVTLTVALALDLPVPLSMALCYHAHSTGQIAVLTAYGIHGSTARRLRLRLTGPYGVLSPCHSRGPTRVSETATAFDECRLAHLLTAEGPGYGRRAPSLA